MSGPPPAPAGRIGPNAVIQLAAALREEWGEDAARRVFEAAGEAALLIAPPAAMIDQAAPARLFAALWREMPEEAAAIARSAGRRTADYVAENRIPGAARLALRLLPARIAARLLLKAIERNAWTFVGTGLCAASARPAPLITIKDNPLAMPEACWHAAVFERLFRRLVTDRATVVSRATRDGRDSRFEIRLGAT